MMICIVPDRQAEVFPMLTVQDHRDRLRDRGGKGGGKGPHRDLDDGGGDW